MTVAGPDNPTIFYVTDRKYQGTTVSKAQIIMRVAHNRHLNIVWHKIAYRHDILGVNDHYRPTYSHMICLGNQNVRPGTSTPDVFYRGPVLWRNGMGYEAAQYAVFYASNQSPELPIINPFCGMGTVLAAADLINVESIGIDNDPERCHWAERTILK